MRRCTICGKQGQTGHSRSHSNIATNRRWFPNLQWFRYHGQRVRACTSCIRTETKRMEVRSPAPATA